jgi:uncharacterized MAPEG superfamily protein
MEGIGMNLSNHPAFVAYAITCVALCCNLIFLWAYSGAARSKAKSTPNPEDASRFSSRLADVDPPEIARVLRAHANAQATIVPFLALGLVYVLAGGPPGAAAWYFTVFTWRGGCTPGPTSAAGSRCEPSLSSSRRFRCWRSSFTSCGCSSRRGEMAVEPVTCTELAACGRSTEVNQSHAPVHDPF